MTDMHTHILPSIDDGPKDEEHALALLRAQADSGVDTVISTSHFYPKLRPIDSFAASRDKRIAAMRELLAENDVNVRLIPGAEVYVDRVLFNYDTLRPLCIGNSSTILFELPDHDTTFEAVCELVQSLAGEYSLDPIIAHVERMPYLLRHYDRLGALHDAGFRLQIDAECFLDRGFFYKQFAIKCVKKGLVEYIGSDCHDLKSRKPNLAEAYRVIEKTCGADAVNELRSNAAALADVS